MENNEEYYKDRLKRLLHFHTKLILADYSLSNEEKERELELVGILLEYINNFGKNKVKTLSEVKK